MFRYLQIPYREERWLVGLADVALRALTFLGSSFRGNSYASGMPPANPPKRILLLRLERVGDLLMVLDAIAMVRALAPQAEIDLVVGSWNLPLARLIPAVNAIETLDVPWMAREGHGLSWRALISRARAWRSKGYDLAINLEPDIRSNLLLALSGAARTTGFVSGGGGDVLSEAVEPDPGAHVAANAMTLVARAFGSTGLKPCATDNPSASRAGLTFQDPPCPTHLTIPEEARRRAAELIGPTPLGRTVIGIQPAAGRQIKEWDPVRFAEVGSALARERGATIVLIGSASDRRALDAVRAAWPADVARVDLPEKTDLVVLAAVLERLTLFITGDTGPMHMAAAVGTPVLAIFGPSLPTRYAPLSAKSRMVRIDIHCSPCNLMRKPPERCVGHVPDCLAGIESAQVLKVAHEMLDA
ncbi:MAG TPA: glycosyltransferase family 9 protein [Vicinamibacterales bacterium]|nr:glycosyltransferase family 9 protein [Vicinamibacterales bacterium]